MLRESMQENGNLVGIKVRRRSLKTLGLVE
jgi:hypothetical protein